MEKIILLIFPTPYGHCRKKSIPIKTRSYLIYLFHLICTQKSDPGNPLPIPFKRQLDVKNSIDPFCIKIQLFSKAAKVLKINTLCKVRYCIRRSVIATSTLPVIPICIFVLRNI